MLDHRFLSQIPSSDILSIFCQALRPGSLYDSPHHEPLLFDHLCLRHPVQHRAPPCVAFGHPFYYRTMFGLDNLIKHYREECVLLALEPDAQLTPANPRFQFIWESGKYDLRGGLRENTHIYLEVRRRGAWGAAAAAASPCLPASLPP